VYGKGVVVFLCVLLLLLLASYIPFLSTLSDGSPPAVSFLAAFWRLSGGFLAAFRRFAGGFLPDSYHMTSIM